MFFCLLCHGINPPGRDLCPECLRQLPWNRFHCERCAEPWDDPFTGLCQHCVTEEPYFDLCYSPLRYAFPVDQLILQGKQPNRGELLLALGRLLGHCILRDRIPLPDLILPVPLHPDKQQTRGFNQAGILARLVARRLRRPLRYDVITKVRERGPQKALSRAERQQNLQRAFRINRTVLRALPQLPRHVVLVDDVMTTGSTLNQLARQLRSSGVERVDGGAVARAARQSR